MLDSSGTQSSATAEGRFLSTIFWPDAAPEERAIESETSRLVACSGDDLGRLAQILRDLGCHARVRGADGAVLPLVIGGSAPYVAEREAQPKLSAPIYDASGDVLAWLDLVAEKVSGADASTRLLESLANTVTRAISERWFRLRYRRQWIVAAQRNCEPVDFIVLAVDRLNRVVGADHWAREVLKAKGLQGDSQLWLAAVFQACTAPLRTGRFSDIAMTMLGAQDGAPWSVLITPPDQSVDPSGQSERALVHARPRLGTLTRVGPPSTRQNSGYGLPARMLRRVEEYIDAHLDSPLGIAELAGSLKMSESHFARCFRQSTGFAPHSYVMRRRLMRAQKLLVETDRALVDIAQATGFADQSHFSRRFHELAGLPPKAFRALHR